MFDVGEAVTEDPVLALSVAAGDQVYVEAPAALSVVEFPLQIVASAEVTVGKALTVTAALVEPVHAFPSVPMIK